MFAQGRRVLLELLQAVGSDRSFSRTLVAPFQQSLNARNNLADLLCLMQIFLDASTSWTPFCDVTVTAALSVRLRCLVLQGTVARSFEVCSFQFLDPATERQHPAAQPSGPGVLLGAGFEQSSKNSVTCEVTGHDAFEPWAHLSTQTNCRSVLLLLNPLGIKTKLLSTAAISNSCSCACELACVCVACGMCMCSA